MNSVRLVIPRVPKSPRPLERDIQRAILEYLQMRGIFAFRVNTGAAMLPGRNGRKQLVRFGFAGVADIIGILDRCWSEAKSNYRIGQFLAIEVKREKGKQTDDQKEFQRAVEYCHGIYILARSVDDVKAVIGGGRGD